ncbi:MAG: hypothetical protein IKB72_04510 [Ruminococcus sp.]|nr:hypothetical protein [Ruminococcus sp.]
MLSIIITVCDKDFENCENLTKQIEERVHIPHEVIIIDNREKSLSVETSWKADYAFGYNAFQFASRAKGIELAKGDYIWFIDGDDSIYEVKDIEFNVDILVFSYNNYPEGDVHLEEELFTENIYTWEMSEKVKPVLWNKFIKKSLFSSDFIKKYATLKINTLEDGIWCNEALRHAESVRIVDKILYFHTEGVSSTFGALTFEQIKNLTTGLNEALKVMRDITDDTFYEKIVKYQYIYIMQFLTKTDDIEQTAELLMDTIPADIFRETLIHDTYNYCYSQCQMKRIVEAVQKRYGETYPYAEIKETVVWEDGTEEEITFPAEMVFDEDLAEAKRGDWTHTLSIVCLVYDKNTDYLYSFTKTIADKVAVRHEVVIVDNREDKTLPLHYYGEAVVTQTEGNVGILDGRRAGFEASHNEYVWFVDIDDYVLSVPNTDYGSSDIIVFSYKYSCEDIIVHGDKIIPKADFFLYDTLYATTSVLWNKWFKRKPLEESYKQIPHFFCVYGEDTMLYFSCLLFSSYIKLTDTAPIYAHSASANSTTLKRIEDTKSVDTIFAGYKQNVAYMKEYFEFAKEVTYLAPVNILFYLQIMAKSTVKEYFAEKVLSLFGKKRIQEAITKVDEYAKADSKELILSVRSYFD